MRDEILECAIEQLVVDGLRFSLDEIAIRLKISKKTIYKFFVSKEELAIGIYEYFYSRVDGYLNECKSDLDFIKLYYSSYRLTNDFIFNKYALNDSIKETAKNNHSIFVDKIKKKIKLKDIDVFIFEGAFRMAYLNKEYENKILERLSELICL